MPIARSTAAAVALLLVLPTALAAQGTGAVTLVLPFALEKFEPRVGWLGEGVAIGVTAALAERGVEVVSRDERLDVFERLQLPPGVALTRATIIKVAELVGASRVVLGRVNASGTDVDHRRAGVAGRLGAARPADPPPHAGDRPAQRVSCGGGVRRTGRHAGRRWPGAGAVGPGLRAVRTRPHRRQRRGAGAVSVAGARIGTRLRRRAPGVVGRAVLARRARAGRGDPEGCPVERPTRARCRGPPGGVAGPATALRRGVRGAEGAGGRDAVAGGGQRCSASCSCAAAAHAAGRARRPITSTRQPKPTRPTATTASTSATPTG